jgi:hypothetical protein
MFGSKYLEQFGIEPFPFSGVDSQGGMFGAAFGFEQQPPADPTAQQAPTAQGAPAPLTSGAPIAPGQPAIPGRRPAPALGGVPGLGGSVASPLAMQGPLGVGTAPQPGPLGVGVGPEPGLPSPLETDQGDQGLPKNVGEQYGSKVT